MPPLTPLVVSLLALAGGPSLVVEPATALVDEPVRIVARGLAPGSQIRLSAVLRLEGGPVLRSEASFLADSAGIVDVARDSARGGSYEGVDPMGLFWSMAPVEPDSTADLPPPCAPPASCRVRIELRAEDSTLLAHAEAERRFLADGVRAVPVREAGVIGTLYLPPGDEPQPVVVALSGSEGGAPEVRAAILASRGFAALAIAYFRAEGLPDELFLIPVETVERAMAWLATREDVDADRIALLGSSKGAELALLAAATYPAVDAVVAYAPTAHVWPGIARDGSSRPESSWSLDGAPVPFAPHVATPEFEAQFQRPPPWRLRLLYEPSAADSAGAAPGEIPVERIGGPILLIAGADDEMLPACANAERIAARLGRQGRNAPTTLCYPGAGHAIHVPYLPAARSAGPFLLGGTAAANARADADSWPRVLDFLREALGGPDLQGRPESRAPDSPDRAGGGGAGLVRAGCVHPFWGSYAP